MCVPGHRNLAGGRTAETVVPRIPAQQPKRVPSQPTRALVAPVEAARKLLVEQVGSDVVTGPALTQREIDAHTGDASPVPVETAEWAGTPQAQALEVQLGTLKARSATVDDEELRGILSDAETALGFAMEYKDDSFLTEAEGGLSKVEARLQVVETAAKVKVAVAPEPKPAVIREPEPIRVAPVATPTAKITPPSASPQKATTAPVTPPAVRPATPPQRPTATPQAPDAERLAKIAKERAIRAALDGAVRQSQSLSGQDFRTKVAPFRDALTKKLAVACGMPEPDDQTLRNPTKRTALFGEIKATVQAAIGEADTRRLLPYFISNPSN